MPFLFDEENLDECRGRSRFGCGSRLPVLGTFSWHVVVSRAALSEINQEGESVLGLTMSCRRNRKFCMLHATASCHTSRADFSNKVQLKVEQGCLIWLLCASSPITEAPDHHNLNRSNRRVGNDVSFSSSLYKTVWLAQKSSQRACYWYFQKALQPAVCWWTNTAKDDFLHSLYIWLLSEILRDQTTKLCTLYT